MEFIVDDIFYNVPLCSDIVVHIFDNDITDKPTDIHLSKYLLCKHSLYFRKAIMVYSIDPGNLNIILSESKYGCEIDKNHLQIFFKMIYGIFNNDLTWDYVSIVVKIADYYDCQYVIDKCANMIKNRLIIKTPREALFNTMSNISQFDEYLLIRLGMIEVYDAVKKIFFDEVNDDFYGIMFGFHLIKNIYRESITMKLSYQMVMYIILCEYDKHYDEADLFNFMLRWIAHDHPNRKVYIDKFISCFRYSQMNQFYLKFFIINYFRLYFSDNTEIIETINVYIENVVTDSKYMILPRAKQNVYDEEFIINNELIDKINNTPVVNNYTERGFRFQVSIQSTRTIDDDRNIECYLRWISFADEEQLYNFTNQIQLTIKITFLNTTNNKKFGGKFSKILSLTHNDAAYCCNLFNTNQIKDRDITLNQFIAKTSPGCRQCTMSILFS
jgi:hypothetical protein